MVESGSQKLQKPTLSAEEKVLNTKRVAFAKDQKGAEAQWLGSRFGSKSSFTQFSKKLYRFVPKLTQGSLEESLWPQWQGPAAMDEKAKS